MSEIDQQISLLKQLQQSLRGTTLTPQQVQMLQQYLDYTRTVVKMCEQPQLDKNQQLGNDNDNKPTNTS